MRLNLNCSQSKSSNYLFRSYGAVYKAITRDESKPVQEVAIKILPCEDDLTKISAEINFLRKLSSPYVVSYITGYNFEDELWVSIVKQAANIYQKAINYPFYFSQIIMEFCAGGSLSDFYEATHRTLTEEELKATMTFCVLGLHHLHSHSSIHRVRILSVFLFFEVNITWLGRQSRKYFTIARWNGQACRFRCVC